MTKEKIKKEVLEEFAERCLKGEFVFIGKWKMIHKNKTMKIPKEIDFLIDRAIQKTESEMKEKIYC